MTWKNRYIGAIALAAGMGLSSNDILSQSLPQRKTLEKVLETERKLPKEFIDAVITAESGGNPNAKRYEPRIDDTSYGLMQILTQTARGLDRKYTDIPTLDLNSDGNTTNEEVKQALLNPEINLSYGKRFLAENLEMYGTLELAAAAYNAGPKAPTNAEAQHKINLLLGTNLDTDGVIGPLSKKAIKKFQEKHSLQVDGIPGKNTQEKLDELFMEKFPHENMKKGRIPQNKRTPGYVDKVMNIYRNNIKRNQ
jgi:hypothetical protein